LRPVQALRTVGSFDTGSPDKLERQLVEFQQAVDDTVRGLLGKSPKLLVPTNLKTAAYTAQLGELVVCKGTFTLTLPVANTATAGRQCGVLVTAAGTITVKAVTGNVQNAATDALATVGLRIYTSVGGSWWRSP